MAEGRNKNNVTGRDDGRDKYRMKPIKQETQGRRMGKRKGRGDKILEANKSK